MPTTNTNTAAATKAATAKKNLSFHERFVEVQSQLKVAKKNWNEYSKFYYRSKEDIMEAAKPLCKQYGMYLICTDDLQLLSNGWVYVVSSASVVDVATGESITTQGLAREQDTKKGMDTAQITGTASSYAGKRALGNLFAIDDTADADAPAKTKTTARQPNDNETNFIASCKSCGTSYQFLNKAQYTQFITTTKCCPSPNWSVV